MATKKKAATKKNIMFESLDSVDLDKKVDLEAGKDAVQTELEKAKEYIMKTPEQINTNYRKEIMKTLNW